jgi:hypothetical protein
MRTEASPKAPAPIGKRSPIAPARRLPRSPAKTGETFCSAPRRGACHSPSIGAPAPMQPEAVPRPCAPVPAIPRECPPEPTRPVPALRAAAPSPGASAPMDLPRSPASAARGTLQTTFRRELARRRRGAEQRNPIPSGFGFLCVSASLRENCLQGEAGTTVGFRGRLPPPAASRQRDVCRNGRPWRVAGRSGVRGWRAPWWEESVPGTRPRQGSTAVPPAGQEAGAAASPTNLLPSPASSRVRGEGDAGFPNALGHLVLPVGPEGGTRNLAQRRAGAERNRRGGGSRVEPTARLVPGGSSFRVGPLCVPAPLRENPPVESAGLAGMAVGIYRTRRKRLFAYHAGPAGEGAGATTAIPNPGAKGPMITEPASATLAVRPAAKPSRGLRCCKRAPSPPHLGPKFSTAGCPSC